jgi:transposase
MASGSKKQYTPEFKREAVALVTEQGYTLAGAARNLGINRDMLRRWKRELAEEGTSAFPGKGHQTPEQAELQRLRAEVRRLQMEREILKKATAFFANESK